MSNYLNDNYLNAWYSMVQHTRVADRLSAAADKSTKKSRSDELQKCKEKFDTFKEQFQPFIATLKTYHTAVVNLEHCRSEVRVSSLSYFFRYSTNLTN